MLDQSSMLLTSSQGRPSRKSCLERGSSIGSVRRGSRAFPSGGAEAGLFPLACAAARAANTWSASYCPLATGGESGALKPGALPNKNAKLAGSGLALVEAATTPVEVVAARGWGSMVLPAEAAGAFA